MNLSDSNFAAAAGGEPQLPPARRAFLLGSAMAAAALAAPGLAAAPHAHAADALTAAVLAATADCIAEGANCDRHCLDLFATGNVELVECARRVRELVTVCTATQALGIQGAPRFAAMVDLCAQTCAACDEECRRHADKHAVCARCAEACQAALKAAAAFTAGRA